MKFGTWDGNIVDYRSWDGWISRDPISSESALLRQSLRPSTDVIITVNVIIIRIWHMGYSGFVSHAPNTSHLMVMKWTSTITWLIPFFKHFSHQRFQIWRWHFPVFQFSSFPVFQFSGRQLNNHPRARPSAMAINANMDAFQFTDSVIWERKMATAHRDRWIATIIVHLKDNRSKKIPERKTRENQRP